jgi:hypothetical protein
LAAVERYQITIDSSVRTKQELFAAVTDTAFLGYSGITNWDAFEELLNERLECEIQLTVLIEDIAGLPARDQRIFAEVFQDAAHAHPGKLILHQTSSSPRT